MAEPVTQADRTALVTFLYLLGRDEVPLGKVESILARCAWPDPDPQRSWPDVQYTNKDLEAWARTVADRLIGPAEGTET